MIDELRAGAERIFREALERTRPDRMVGDNLRVEDARLLVVDEVVDLDAVDRIVVVAFGKAAAPMLRPLIAALDERITAGLLATRAARVSGIAPDRWATFEAGHPLPNRASLRAGRAALDLCAEHDGERTLCLFLVSGGGSAMLEAPAHPSWTLEELRATNRELVTCGATIDEINAVRRTLSAVKGGRLAAAAPRARKISLYVSDVNPGDIPSIASGPTWLSVPERPRARDVVLRYGLEDRLPPRLVEHAIESRPWRPPELPEPGSHHVLLDNDGFVRAAAEIARGLGYDVGVESDLVETGVEELTEVLLQRALKRRAAGGDRPWCLLSGGEPRCPVRGTGRGGRNQELALRVALAMERLDVRDLVFMSAGTDGIDGNSDAAGAVCDGATIERACRFGVDAHALLQNSDSHSFFAAVGGVVVTGPTAHNVRDVRMTLGPPGSS